MNLFVGNFRTLNPAIRRNLVRCSAVLTLISLFLLVGTASATILVPTIYDATVGEGTAQRGYYDYFDDGYRQLVDEFLGVDDWDADLGNGPAFEWVGWREANPIITFEFGEPVTITEVRIDFNRTEYDALIFLPKKVIIGDTQFSVARDELDEGTSGTITFQGSWTGSSLRVKLADWDVDRWIFVDEVAFRGSSQPVPEPSAIALGVLGFCLAAFGRRSNR